MMINKLSRDGQQRLADFAFGLMAAFGVLGLFGDSFDTTPLIPNAPNPMLTGLGSAILMIAVAIVTTKAAALDRKNAEEYTFQLMANGAVVSVMTTLFVTFIWSSEFLLGRWLGAPSQSQILALLLGSWAIGYFAYRTRGTQG